MHVKLRNLHHLVIRVPSFRDNHPVLKNSKIQAESPGILFVIYDRIIWLAGLILKF